MSAISKPEGLWDHDEDLIALSVYLDGQPAYPHPPILPCRDLRQLLERV